MKYVSRKEEAHILTTSIQHSPDGYRECQLRIPNDGCWGNGLVSDGSFQTRFVESSN